MGLLIAADENEGSVCSRPQRVAPRQMDDHLRLSGTIMRNKVDLRMEYERAVDLHHLNVVWLVAGPESLVDILVFAKSSDE